MFHEYRICICLDFNITQFYSQREATLWRKNSSTWRQAFSSSGSELGGKKGGSESLASRCYRITSYIIIILTVIFIISVIIIAKPLLLIIRYLSSLLYTYC